jgi:hypothetical protein
MRAHAHTHTHTHSVSIYDEWLVIIVCKIIAFYF